MLISQGEILDGHGMELVLFASRVGAMQYVLKAHAFAKERLSYFITLSMNDYHP